MWNVDLRGAEQGEDGLEKQGLYRVLRWKLQRLRAVPLCSQYQVDPLQVGRNHNRIREPWIPRTPQPCGWGDQYQLISVLQVE